MGASHHISTAHHAVLLLKYLLNERAIEISLPKDLPLVSFRRYLALFIKRIPFLLAARRFGQRLVQRLFADYQRLSTSPGRFR
jgi:hypothetical protein